MKKGATPELNQKWWSKNKAKTLKKTGLGDALKSYEVAIDLMDDPRALKSLSDVKKKVAGAFGLCKKKEKFYSDTIAALKKYPGIIQKEETRLAKKIKELTKGGGAAAPPKQKVGKDVVIWKRDIASEVKKIFSPDWLKDWKGTIVQLKLNDDILDVLEKEEDYATPAFMVEDAQDACKKTVTAIAKIAANIHKKGSGHDTFPKLAKQEIKSLEAEIKKIPQARWNKFVARKKQYKDYKIKSGFDVALGTLGTIGSGLAIAAAVPTGGATLALGIVGGIRSVTALTQTCYDLAIEAEKVEKGLKKDLEDLKKSYLKVDGEAKKSAGAKEVAKSTMSSLLNAYPPFVASLPKCDKNYTLWDNKAAGLEVNGRKLTKAFIQLFKKVDAFEKEMKTAKSKEAGKLLDKVKKLRVQLTKSFDKAATMNGRVKTADKNMPAIKKLLDALKDKNADYAKIFDKVFPVVVNLALAGANAGIGFTDAKTAMDTASTALGLGNDLLSEVKSQIE
ncbi:MAG: hypothetical protein O7G85_17360 [Planctomycetota bacterium]|nr:hypothetical protein [Planctomycetota bacterium]